MKLGTRTQTGLRHEHATTRTKNQKFTRDLGLKDNVTSTFTFTAVDGRITGSGGDFTSKFYVGETVKVGGTNLNNGEFIVTGLDVGSAGYLTLDPAPKNEGPLSCTIRSA